MQTVSQSFLSEWQSCHWTGQENICILSNTFAAGCCCSEYPVPCRGHLKRRPYFPRWEVGGCCSVWGREEKENQARHNAPCWLMGWIQRQGLPTCSLWALVSPIRACVGCSNWGLPQGECAPPLRGMHNTTLTQCTPLSLLLFTLRALGEILAGCFLLFI